MEEQIGNAAGVVWRALDEHGTMTTSKLKQQTKLAEPVVFMAVGWLAREHKVTLAKVKNSVRVSLNTSAPFSQASAGAKNAGQVT